VVYDKLQVGTVLLRDRRCLVIPSVHTGPHLMVKFDSDLPVVVQFPATIGPRPDPPSLSTVRKRLGVLSDPVRLSLCRHLLGEPITTSELASRTRLTEPQVSRHLARLRDAGLIRSQRDGRMVYHRLASDVIMQLGPDILATIVH
jgi:DNA-binding transcriptional ArsR family regulator